MDSVVRTLTEKQEMDTTDQAVKTSPDGRWEKSTTKLAKKDFPYLNTAYLAMDSEEGVEVAWIELKIKKNELHLLTRIEIFMENLMGYNHHNLLKFNQYWFEDVNNEKVLFLITESLNVGSVGQFIRRGQLNQKNVTPGTWKRWCKQILVGINYLHHRSPPCHLHNISYENLFIQHNGLVKISLLHSLVCSEMEYFDSYLVTHLEPTAGRQVMRDLYIFGFLALSMTCVDMFHKGNEEDVHDEALAAKLGKLQEMNLQQYEFITLCFQNKNNQLTVNDLLVHPVLFEIPSLKLMCTYKYNKMAVDYGLDTDGMDPISFSCEMYTHGDEVNAKKFTESNFSIKRLDEFIKEVSLGMYPITCVEQIPSKLDYSVYFNGKYKSSMKSDLTTDTSKVKTQSSVESNNQMPGNIIVVGKCVASKVKKHLNGSLDHFISSFDIKMRLLMDNNTVLSLKSKTHVVDTDAEVLARDLVNQELVCADDLSFLASMIALSLDTLEPVVCMKEV